MKILGTAASTIVLITGLGMTVSETLAQVVATDVICSRCVDTTDIELQAVTSGRLRDGAVSSAKIQDGAVTGSKLAPGAVTNSRIAVGAVREGRLADGAVTNKKIALGAVREGRLATDSVSTAKLQDGAVTAAKLASDAVFQRIVVVGPVGDGTNTSNNGLALLGALAAITTASATERWLIKLEPGEYDVGTNTLAMKRFVDIKG